MEGNEVSGNGGRLTCGSVGMVVGMLMLGSGDKVGLGRDGIEGKGGMLTPIEGKGENVVGLVKVGMVGIFGELVVCKR
ncbi:hypothetical protein Lal_00041404 [Lupinus albus]|nr:hypothetical protein Lal_00041404 [Lupinus albus]